MTVKVITLLLVGVIFIFLGLLWFLQGSDIIRLRPILCVANCEPLTGRSLLWQVVGAVVFIGGIVSMARGIQRLRHKN
jgi:uncharacterized membrane protein HdeD (DUF308 family)